MAGTVVIGVSGVLVYLDLCEAHHDELLRGARPIGSARRLPAPRQKGEASQHTSPRAERALPADDEMT